jgi:nucleotide-binding universal stress UspA family protein
LALQIASWDDEAVLMTDNDNSTDLATPPTSQPNHKPRIVVGIDGSPQSELALRWAQRVASDSASVIEAVIAWQYPVSASGWAPVPTDWQPAEDAEKALTELVDSVFGADRPPGMQLFVREGNAARVLLDASVDAQMLVVGSRGHGGFIGLLLGSVSANCAEHAECPVLVVH